jgi:precorrin-6A/cobalt-precorrin-6A reductase
MAGPARVLILGGTTEARRLAAVLAAGTTPEPTTPEPTTPAAASPTPAAASPAPAAASPTPALGGSSEPARSDGFDASSTGPRYSVISSLAGRTSNPLRIAGEVRVGGFGGVAGLVRYLHDERIDAVVDATHPFAATMTGHAVEAAGAARVPIVVLRRPGWAAAAGDDWRRVRDLTEAAALVPRLGDRVFLTTGRQSVGAFAGVDGVWFLSRSVEPPSPPLPKRLEVVLDRGPFTGDGELRLMRGHRINVLVTKDSGGFAPKLAAARELGLPVVMVDRPAVPDVPAVATVEEAVAWLETALPKVAER